MKKHIRLSAIFAVSILLSLAVGLALAQEPPTRATPPATTEPVARPLPSASVTDHSINVQGAVIDYAATVGSLQLKDDAGKPLAEMFFIAYMKKGVTDVSKRPLTFAFNGGPGSSSIWLDLGAVGPQRVRLADDGKPLPPPPQRVDNESTWLDLTDLVCIDPVGTGFSRPAPGVDSAKFYEVRQDAQSVADFIRIYLTNYDRWLSPKFIAGESYGGTRAAILADLLPSDFGVNLNGLVLISPVIDFGTLNTLNDRSTDLAFALDVPSYATTAWYHKKLAPDLQADFQGLVGQVEQWSITEYLPALIQGDALPTDAQAGVARQLSRYTGISEAFIQSHHLRLAPYVFRQELLRDQQLVLSAYDSRFSYAPNSGTDYIAELLPAFVPVFNDYLRTELNYQTDQRYVPLSNQATRSWNWGPGGLSGYLNVTDDLRQAMKQNRSLKVLVARGYYDLDVPYFGTEYALNRLELEPDLQANLVRAYYESGHTLYTFTPALEKLKSDVSSFMRGAIPAPSQ